MKRLIVIMFATIGWLLPLPTLAEPDEWSHATALTGIPKYPKGFAHYDYVYSDAPKGGRVRLSSLGGFDTFNPILPKGELPTGMGLIYESLMVSALDELDISAMYGQIAESIRHPADFSSVSFKLNPDARWNDGKPITVDDVIWSFNTTVEINPRQAYYYANVKKAEKTGELEVTFTFNVKDNRELPHIMGQLMILPKHWWEGTAEDGKKRDIKKGTLEPPLGSGPYRIGRFSPGRSITYTRVENHWGAGLNTNTGQNNFDEVQYESYLDRSVMLQAFKGDEYDFRLENSAKDWATGYEQFPARKKGYAILEKFPDKARGVMQGFVFNTRRDQLKDPRVRRALGYAFDFETLNRTIFYKQYFRVDSYFSGTELASSGLPEGKELEILETVRGEVPEEVFTTEFTNPVGGGPKQGRANLRAALKLLKQAGWTLNKRKLVNKNGEQLKISYLDYSPNGQRYALPYKKALEKIGIVLEYRMVDTAQYISRLRSFDYDMIGTVWSQSLSPGNEQRSYFGSVSAERQGSRNFAGIANPAIDKLIDRIIFAKDREELIAATRAMDRVLLWNYYVVPQWFLPFERTARWDRFGRPEKLPEFDIGFPSIWWWDEKKAARIKAGN